MPTTAKTIRAIDRLRKAANLEPTKKKVTLSDGTTFEISREEIDVTTIGGTPTQFTPFRKYIAGFGDGTGTATAYFTNEDTAMVNRMVQDVLQRQQVGASMKLYMDQVFTGGSVSDTLSRFIEFEATLTAAALNVNPDDAQTVSVEFRPAVQPTFDFATT